MFSHDTILFHVLKQRGDDELCVCPACRELPDGFLYTLLPSREFGVRSPEQFFLCFRGVCHEIRYRK